MHLDPCHIECLGTRLRSIVRFLMIVILLSSIACGSSSNSEVQNPVSPGNVPSDQSCRTFPANVGPPFSFPTRLCGPIGPVTATLVSNLNIFWQSRVEACSCLTPDCVSNGVVFADDPARIYYDASLLSRWDQQYGTPLPSDIFMAHEMGHTVQLRLGLPVVHRELQADCLAGFFLGNRSCKGEASSSDVLQTFQNFCAIGTPTGATWLNPSVHGSCAQRVAAVEQGMNGYLQGMLPLQACPL